MLRAGAIFRSHRGPLFVGGLLLLGLATLVLWLQLSYVPPAPQVFSIQIQVREVLVRPRFDPQPPLGVAVSPPAHRLEIAPDPVPLTAAPDEPSLRWATIPLPALLPLTLLPASTVWPPRPAPPPAAGRAAVLLAASAPRAAPRPLLALTRQPQVPAAVNGIAIGDGFRVPAALAPLPPLIAAASGRAWMAYARPYPAAARPRIAIVLWGLGASSVASEAALRLLPGEITFGLTPHGSGLQFWADRARAAGHELLLEVPMEPLGYPEVDPGKQALLTKLSEAENGKRLVRLLGVFRGYVGITNFMGSRFTTSEAHLRPVLQTLKARGLIFLDSRANDDSIAYRLAGEIGLDRARNNRYIDNEVTPEAIDARLAELAEAALTQGTAVGIGLPHAVTIERLARWHPGLAARGLELAPLSAVIEAGSGG